MRCTGDVFEYFFAFVLIFAVGGKKEEKKCTNMNGTIGRCLPLSRCFDVYTNMEKASNLVCKLPSNAPGICCSSKPKGRSMRIYSNKNSSEGTKIDFRKFGSSTNSATTYSNNFTLGFWTKLLPKSIIQKARLTGLRKLLVRERIEAELQHLGVTIKLGTPEFLHQQFLQPFPEALKQSRLAILQDESNKAILSKFPTHALMGRISRQGFNLSGICPIRPCNFIQTQNKYRSVDGSCNNIEHGNWGSAFIALDRLLPPQYKDRFTQPRQTGVDGLPLPSARKISSICIEDVNRQSSFASLITMTWGQFINHDVTLTALSAMSNGAGIKCCSGVQTVLQLLRHEDCFPIDIARDDPFYGPTGRTCMEFVRSLPAASERKSCEFGFRDQLNEVTSFLDGSVIYGSTNSMARALRLFNKGKLKVIKCFGTDHLPFINPNSSSCDKPFQSFFTGDIRASEQAHLSSLHTIFMRQHNRVAEALSSINSHWSDETVYQESRKIVSAMLQHISYNEFLPVVIGSQIMESADLKPLQNGYSNNYRSDINPGIFNEFAAAANRYGHSLIQGTLQMLNAQDEVEGTLNVRDQFAAPVPLYFPQNLDRIIRGLTKQAVQKADAFMTHDVTRHLYQINSRFGLDLAAANIQRGRDHGIAPYNAYRQFCGLDKATSFDNLHVKQDIRNKLKKVYRNVDDIDLWIGLMSEEPLKGALVGPTLSCLLAEQYWRIKVGDRFWYENRNSPGVFTLEQLREIRRITLARLLCDNGDAIHQMQPLAFLQPADWNPRTPCDSDAIPKLNVEPWQEVRSNDSNTVKRKKQFASRGSSLILAQNEKVKHSESGFERTASTLIRMESDEYFTIRYLTKSREKSRSRSNSMNRLDANTRRYSNSFCNTDSIDYSMSHLSKELNLLGFSFVYHSGSGPKDSDIVNLINASYELIQYQKRNMKIHEELENKNLRLNSDLDSLHSTNHRLKDSISQYQRNIANLQEQERQLNNQNKSLHQKLKSKLEEVKRLQSVQQQRETQALHDARKKEREMEKLREKLQQLLSDRSKDRHSGMDVINLLQRKDGARGKWKTNNLENKQEDEMYQMIIKDFEERHRLIMEENINLRQLLADMNKELTMIVNCMNMNVAKDPKSDSIDFETYHPEGQFNMPYELMQEKVKKSMKDKFSLLKQRFLESAKGGKAAVTAKNISASTNSSNVVPAARKVIEHDFTQSSLSPSTQ